MTVAALEPSTPPLARPVTTLWGVGPERAAQLGRLEIFTIEDLLLHRPRRYENRREFRPIAELQLHDSAITHGKVVASGIKWFKKRTKSIFELILDDGTARLHCRWWNLPYMEKYFAKGDEVVVFGRVLGLKPRTMDHPETEVLDEVQETLIHLNRIAPIYPLTEGLPQRWVRALIWRTLEQLGKDIPEPWPQLRLAQRPMLENPSPAPPPGTPAGRGQPAAPASRTAESATSGQPGACYPTRAQAIQMLHFPERLEDVAAARRRLALDEFTELQRRIRLRRQNFEVKAEALPCAGDNHLIKPFLGRLGFNLTEAQKRVLRQLRKDLSGRHPMRRLLQGDVGAGKTLVAACCALMALESGYHVALMAPTEILAEQHFRNFRQWFEPLGLGVALQTGSRKLPPNDGRTRRDTAPPRSTAVPGRSSPPTLFIGTHALIESGFAPDHLGLVIIDEQHKFGVVQREQLVRKGRYPHLLVMTATPIPRTLGLTLYGELDVSVLDELPPGRGRLRTFVRTADQLRKVWAFMREQLGAGRQAYVVYPRVEETGPGVKAVTREFETLQRELSPFRMALLHGRLKSHEKEAAMRAFRANTAQVLLTTSLIEVGVDVPNATLMLIESAEQFGLAQLHQLRGRIGRGAHDSYCILIAAARNPEARRRLEALEQTTDGFQIAEADLRLRGPGELLGQQQSGMPKFRFGDLAEDLDLILLARNLAAELTASAG